MCDHSFGETLEGCRIVADPVTGAVRCWANRPDRPARPRSAVEERLAALDQGARSQGPGREQHPGAGDEQPTPTASRFRLQEDRYKDERR
jgi:hypothetical protein